VYECNNCNNFKTGFGMVHPVGNLDHRGWPIRPCLALGSNSRSGRRRRMAAHFQQRVPIVSGFQSKGIGSILWKLLIALLYLGAGFYFITHPVLGMAALTLGIAIFFLVEGVADLVTYFKERKSPGSGWILLDGIVTLLLGLLIWRHWPSSASWVVGLLLGISMLMTGMTRLMITLAARRLRAAPAV